MNTMMLFTDGSADIKSGIGFGAFLAVPYNTIPSEELKKQVRVRRFENTSSTRLELETLLWALSSISAKCSKVEIYTDSQNIIGLVSRRNRLEQNNYLSNNRRLVSNHDLYIEFFKITDQLNYEMVKAKGHQPTGKKNTLQQLFTFVDKASRNALRKELSRIS
jgi:ribonuclease HI